MATTTRAVPEVEPLVREVVPRLVEALEPERLWLFGSRARGDHHDHSDWDVMVVLARAPTREDRTAANAAIEGVKPRPELHLWGHAAFHDRLHLRASFPSTVVREGVLLWEAQSVSLVDARMWLGRARSDVRAATILLDAEPPEVADVYVHMQQALEKAGKALLALHDVPVRKTHALEEIGGALRRAEPDLGGRLIELKELGEKGLAWRYPVEDALPTPDEAGTTLAGVRGIVEEVAAKLG
jgi:predicted nucleotidyltransferase/HEPN domain-containing protein